MNSKVYFILSCARSGSTSLARILDGATNGVCQVEPMPNLNDESRLAMDGKLSDRMTVVQDQVGPRVKKGLNEHEVYGDKNLTYGPFIRELHEAFDARFVFLHRDGRDVVNSLINWHEQLFGNIYRDCCEAGSISARARSAAASLPVWRDSCDFSRPRPGSGDRWFAAWESFSRLEMCAYYWARINALYLDELADLPSDAWVRVDYTRATGADVVEVGRFLKLSGLEAGAVQAQLDHRINSLADRDAGEGRAGPWMSWTSRQREQFTAIAGGMMERLGYWSSRHTRWRPEGCTHVVEASRSGRETFIEWIKQQMITGDRIGSISDFGGAFDCGSDLPEVRYSTVALSDMTEPRAARRSDLVAAHGILDVTHDIDALLTTMVSSARGWIYLTFRGWETELGAHCYRWDKDRNCFETRISPRQLEATLQKLGCHGVVFDPSIGGSSETRVFARVPSCSARDRLVKLLRRREPAA
jgi:hypothetical protein